MENGQNFSVENQTKREDRKCLHLKPKAVINHTEIFHSSGMELFSMTAIFSIVHFHIIAGRNINIPVALNDTTKSFGNESLLKTLYTRLFSMARRYDLCQNRSYLVPVEFKSGPNLRETEHNTPDQKVKKNSN